jgi:hypothetical protein
LFLHEKIVDLEKSLEEVREKKNSVVKNQKYEEAARRVLFVPLSPRNIIKVLSSIPFINKSN